MTAAQSSWIRTQIAEGLRRRAELLAAKQAVTDWPRRAWDDPPAMLVYSSEAMFAYYLGPDGTAYSHDLDRFGQTLDVITDPDEIRTVYAKAAELHPELAGLAG